MKPTSFVLALAACATLAPLAIADTAVKQMKVRSAAEVQRIFGLAAAERGRQAIEISCSPAGSTWCAEGFVAACDKAKGGMSTGPDGSVTCSLPQHE